MQCPNCRANVSELARFCSQCGSALVVSCPACGNSEEPGAKFCGKCGTNLAGPALIEGIGRLESPEPLQIRVGIATGLVVVGDLIGSGNDTEVLGEVPNLAARLLALAEPNTITIADSTRRQIGSVFALEDLGFKD